MTSFSDDEDPDVLPLDGMPQAAPPGLDSLSPDTPGFSYLRKTAKPPDADKFVDTHELRAEEQVFVHQMACGFGLKQAAISAGWSVNRGKETYRTRDDIRAAIRVRTVDIIQGEMRRVTGILGAALDRLYHLMASPDEKIALAAVDRIITLAQAVHQQEAQSQAEALSAWVRQMVEFQKRLAAEAQSGIPADAKRLETDTSIPRSNGSGRANGHHRPGERN